MGYSVLLIEDEGLTSQSLYYSLQHNDQTITLVHTPENAGAKITTRWPDLIVFNLLTGALDLDKFGRAIDQTDLNLPRLVLAKEQVSPAIAAEALIHPPYTDEQLMQEIKAIVDQDRFLRVGRFTLDTRKHCLLRGGCCYDLTPKLYDLLHLLMQHEGEIVHRKTIMQQVWETDYMGDTRTLDVHIRWVRVKIEDDPSHPKHLLTERGVGYRFVATTD